METVTDSTPLHNQRVSSEILDAALKLATLGWLVFPCATAVASDPESGKRPLSAKGLLDATTDQAQIRAWWAQWPSANIGVATGRASGFWVLDCDPRHGGEESLRAIEAAHGAIPNTPLSLTGGGGSHYLFSMPPDGDVRNSASRLAPGLDVRGAGGYVIVPPSRHSSGRVYTWDAEAHPEDLPIAAAPPWLLDLVRQRPQPAQPLEAEIGEGRRNEILTSLGGSMRRRGASVAAIEAALSIENRDRCRPPLHENEVRQIAASVSKYAPAGEGPRVDWQGSAGTTAGNDGTQTNGSTSGQADNNPKTGFKFLSIDDVLAMPPTEWLIEDWVPSGSLAVLYGTPGAGKSFVGLSWLLSVAAGRRWVDTCNVRGGHIVLCVGEGLGGLRKRFLAAALDQAGDLLGECRGRFHIGPMVPRLLDAAAVNHFLAGLAALPERPRLVVCDTLAWGLAGGDENSAGDMGRAVEALDAVRRATGAAVLCVHHAGKNEERGARGSSALLGGMDTMLSLKAEGDEDLPRRVTLRVEKQKDEEPPPPLALILEKVKLGIDARNRDITSLRVRRQTEAERSAGDNRADQAIVSLLSRPEYVLGLSRSEMMEILGLAKTTLHRALDRLMGLRVLRKLHQKYLVAGVEK